ncbi:hypothetical protein LDENG_00259840 [Lucifuga dentata]|nr:hypothetical protein LDENG_00259840 [Lucifuga dentata]
MLQKCFDFIKTWMPDNFLQLNENKTEVLICAPASLIPKVVENLRSLSSFIKSTIRYLAVTFDQGLTFDSHVTGLVCSCLY